MGSNENLRVCEHCLWAIESREGNQPAIRYFVDEDDMEESTCMWCGESGFDVMYDIIG